MAENGVRGVPNLPTDEDNHSHTVMSYGFPGESPGTPMAYDVLALQYLYGARAYRGSNDLYQFTDAAIDQYALGGQLFINPSLLTKQVIWDSGGYNTLDMSGFTPDPSGYRLDLRPLGWLTTNANYLTTYLNAGAVVGPDVLIHKLVNSGGNDTIYATCEVIGKKDKDDKFGVVTFLIKALNQHGEVCQQSEWSLLMLRKREDVEALVASSIPTEKPRAPKS